MSTDHPRHGWKQNAKHFGGRLTSVYAPLAIGAASLVAGGGAPAAAMAFLQGQYTRPKNLGELATATTVTLSSLASYSGVYHHTHSLFKVAAYAALTTILTFTLGPKGLSGLESQSASDGAPRPNNSSSDGSSLHLVR